VAFTEDELAWLYVHPIFQRRGIGRKLAEFAISQMDPGEKTVEVLCGNMPANKLYVSLGFTKETVVHGKMPGNESFDVTVWQLTMEHKE
jgi:ribosomal protein S18 acetylase RimI-like enzyme